MERRDNKGSRGSRLVGRKTGWEKGNWLDLDIWKKQEVDRNGRRTEGLELQS